MRVLRLCIRHSFRIDETNTVFVDRSDGNVDDTVAEHNDHDKLLEQFSNLLQHTAELNDCTEKCPGSVRLTTDGRCDPANEQEQRIQVMFMVGTQCLGHILTWITNSSPSPRRLVMAPKQHMDAMQQPTLRHLNTCVHHLLLGCSFQKVRSWTAGMIESFFVSEENALINADDADHNTMLPQKTMIQKYLCNLLVSQLTASPNKGSKEYIELLGRLVLRDRAPKDTIVSVVQPFQKSTITCCLTGEIIRIGSSTHTTYSEDETNTKGLVNQGNTCYMNSVLQQIYAIDEIRYVILNYNPHMNTAVDVDDISKDNMARAETSNPICTPVTRTQKKTTKNKTIKDKRTKDGEQAKPSRKWNCNDVMLATQHTFQCLNSWAPITHDPVNLVRACWYLKMKWGPFTQNDASEFLDTFTSCIEERLNADSNSVYKTCIAECLDSHTTTMLSCTKCGRQTTKQREVERQITVAVRHGNNTTTCRSIEDCLREHTMQYTLRGNEMVDCVDCKQQTVTTKTSTFSGLAPVPQRVVFKPIHRN